RPQVIKLRPTGWSVRKRATVPEYDENGQTVTEEQEEQATPTAPAEAEVEAELDPVAELRQKLRYAPGDWHVVHSDAGHENKAKTNLETRITSLDMEEDI